MITTVDHVSARPVSSSRSVYDRTMADNELVDLAARMVERDERQAKVDDWEMGAAYAVLDGFERGLEQLADTADDNLMRVQFESQALLLRTAIEKGDPGYLRATLHVVGLIIRGALEEALDEQGVPPR